MSVLVGRGSELRILETALADAKAGRGRLVMITGEAGIGKSRLGQEILDLAQAAGLAQ